MGEDIDRKRDRERERNGGRETEKQRREREREKERERERERESCFHCLHVALPRSPKRYLSWHRLLMPGVEKRGLLPLLTAPSHLLCSLSLSLTPSLPLLHLQSVLFSFTLVLPSPSSCLKPTSLASLSIRPCPSLPPYLSLNA